MRQDWRVYVNLQKKDFIKGVKLGMPVALGYLPVSFSFGMIAVQGGIPVWTAIVISMTNLTSAGQFAATSLMMTGAGLTEIGITTLVINLRYMLMSLSLSQKIEKLSFIKRMAVSFGITDEIFAIAATTPHRLTFPFMTGLIASPYIGWSLGTVLGACVNNLLPDFIASAMGITLYAMFIAIVIPASRRDKAVLCVLIISVILSCLIYYFMPFISSGWAIIITAVLASAAGAVFFPKGKKEEDMADV